MKRKILILFISGCLLLVSSSCQKTLANAIVVGKGDRQLEEKILDVDSSAIPIDLPKNGTRITETIEHASLPIKIQVDATVEMQDDKALPSVKVLPHNFTQDEVDRFVDYFVGDAYFADYFAEGYPLKTGALEGLADYEEWILYEKSKTLRDEELISRLEKNLEEYRQAYAVAVDIEEVPAASKILSNSVFSGDSVSVGIAGNFERDGQICRLFVQNTSNGKQTMLEFWRNTNDKLYLEPTLEIVGAGHDIGDMKYETALAIAEETVQGIGAHELGMRLVDAQGTLYQNDEIDSYYDFIFTREINGVLCYYDGIAIADDYSGSEELRPETLNYEPWPYEKLFIRVDELGLQSVYWSGAIEIVETLAEDTELLPFEDIKECFNKMAFIKNSNIEDYLNWSYVAEDGELLSSVSSVEIYVSKITLSLMRVQAGQDFILIPVWDFYGYKELLNEDGINYELAAETSTEKEIEEQRSREEKRSFLTINAIDGSVIDRQFGY